MRIIGPDELVFGVDDLNACRTFLVDYGLDEENWEDGKGGTFVALDNTAITVRARDDSSLPKPLPSGSTLRQTIYGVEDASVLDEIEAELSTDREVTRDGNGAIALVDDVDMALKFQVTRRIDLDLEAELINSPGAAPLRGVNKIGALQDAPAKPRTLSHIVYFTPDMTKHEAFYVERLKFVVTDRFTNVGPFLRPQACKDHHTLFMLATPPYMQGLEHLAFHMQGPTDLMLAGSRLVQKGYESFWGPGRHKFGSNWFWYFNCPLMTHFEYDADMDIHDDDWAPREIDVSAEASQLFLFENVEKWFPGAGPKD
ncbi:VOC family protein [Maritimibacter dapengensis]|uniref:VOC family protein n=1 Tax=Maritimibacter dapengensis TaxID=2836868 RepID=A0ABS6T7W8_9RHOB|nr:VOC family protein [Maritimibacter dapengensis]MBV7380626.1 VOC family protein [Maritimibacter dapengensis]